MVVHLILLGVLALAVCVMFCIANTSKITTITIFTCIILRVIRRLSTCRKTWQSDWRWWKRRSAI